MVVVLCGLVPRSQIKYLRNKLLYMQVYCTGWQYTLTQLLCATAARSLLILLREFHKSETSVSYKKAISATSSAESFIVGASYLKRLFIKCIIKFASVFSTSKVLSRIRFVEMDQVKEAISDENMPMALGGKTVCKLLMSGY